MFIAAALAVVTGVPYAVAQAPAVAERTSGRILLQVERHGEAWYVHPKTNTRYALGRPAEALAVLQATGLGITEKNLMQLPVGIIPLPTAADTDSDGLPDRLENALHTDPAQADTDSDGHSDYTEVTRGYDPRSASATPLPFNEALMSALQGRIVLQTESAGEAWYVDPVTRKRYYLGAPAEALHVMQRLGLGIRDSDLAQIPLAAATEQRQTSVAPRAATPTPAASEASGAQAALHAVADALANNNAAAAKPHVHDTAAAAFDYTASYLDAAGKQTLSEIMYAAQPEEIAATKATYAAAVPFNGQMVTVRFVLTKNAAGDWLLMNV